MVAAVVVLADQFTKHWAIDAVGDGHVIDVIGRCSSTWRSTAAWRSRGDGLGPIIAVVAVVVVAVLLVAVGREGSRIRASPRSGDRRRPRQRGRPIVPRRGWFHGQVVDFIDLQWWPIFNVADMAIVVGGVLLILSTLRAS